MKTLIPLMLISLNLLIFSEGAEAQVNYSQLGVRAGNRSVGLMARFYSGNSNGAMETLMMLDHAAKDFTLATVYEQHIIVPSVKGLSFYTGAGVHVGYKCAVINTVNNADISQELNNLSKISVPDQPSILYWGIDAIGGIDYHFPHSAFHISADIKPGMSLTKNSLEIFNNAVKLGIDL